MPTEFEMRQRNAKFMKDAANPGKKATHLARRDQKQSPVSGWLLGALVFVVIGGVFFEIARILFL